MQSLVELSGKESGELIKHDDWNDLVGHVEALSTRVEAGFDDVDDRLGTLSDGIQALGEQLAGLEGRLDTLVRGKFRVTLTTGRSRFLLGERGEIEARLTDLAGNAPDLSTLGELPWIDFVTVWGRFRTVPGFTTRSGVENRSVTVQVNAQGVARVALLAEQEEEVTEEVEQEVEAIISPGVRAAIFGADTPVEATQAGAFTAFTLEYERQDANAFRHFVDSRVIRDRVIGIEPTRILPTHGWRDYRTTVMAFVKADDEPGSPDLSHGGASTSITFRDWTRPWVMLDFLALDDLEVGGTARGLGLAIGAAGNFSEATREVHRMFAEMRGRTGFLGRMRTNMLFNAAFTRVELDEPPSYFRVLEQSFTDSIALQSAIEGFAAGGAGAGAGVRLATNLAVRSSEGAAGLGEMVQGLQGQLQQFSLQLETTVGQSASLESELDSLGARTSGLESASNQLGQRFDSIDSRVTSVDTRVNGVDTAARDAVVVAQRTQSRIENLPIRIQRVNDQVIAVDDFMRNLGNQLNLLQGQTEIVNEEMRRIDREVRTVAGRLERTVDVDRFSMVSEAINTNLESIRRSVPDFQPRPILVGRG